MSILGPIAEACQLISPSRIGCWFLRQVILDGPWTCEVSNIVASPLCSGEESTMQEMLGRGGPLWVRTREGGFSQTETGGWVGSGSALSSLSTYGHLSSRRAQVFWVSRVPVALGPAASGEAAQGLAYAKTLREPGVTTLEG